MNRLIIIGNGFDKAHGLETSYPEFMNWYWDQWQEKLAYSDKRFEDDELCSFKLTEGCSLWYMAFGNNFGIDVWSYNGVGLKNFLSSKNGCEFKQSLFLENINNSIDLKGWVDIEEEYYNLLKSSFNPEIHNNYYKAPEKLNKELSELTHKLIKYLTYIQNKKRTLQINEVERLFYESVSIKEISVLKQNEFDEHIMHNLKLDRPTIAKLNKRYYGSSVEDQMQELEEFKQQDYDNSIILDKIKNDRHLLESLSFPNKILVLSFCNTNTESLYVKEGVNVVHIHGDLTNPGSIIFGYGDELDDDYKELQKTNNNEYLKNIKSIRYLESERYREVLEFIESSPYQIYILGHSCGTSDRTLLNTLFEHRNCISIKPYYYQKDGHDNYLDLVENISRNFTDMKLMRDIVVNKTFCSPLPQYNKEN